MLNQKLTLKTVSSILQVSPITITRLSKTDNEFPTVSKIGRSLFIDRDMLYNWLSLKAGQEVKPEDQLLTGKDLQSTFNKSHTWIWQNVKSGVLPKPFKIDRSTYWLENSFKEKSVETQAEHVHLFGLKDHYKHKGHWSWFLMGSLAFMVLFQSLLLVLVGIGVLNFEPYKWLLPVLLVHNLGQIIGLIIFVVKSLFK